MNFNNAFIVAFRNESSRVKAMTRDVPDIRLAGYPDIFSNPVPAKMVPGTGYLSRIVLGPFWQLVELSSPSKWAPYCKHVHLNFKELVSHVEKLFYIY